MKIFGHLVAYLILAGAVYFAYLLVTSNDQTRIAVLTALVSVGTLIYTQTLASKREIAARQFAKKSEAYEEIMRTLGSLMSSSRKGEAIDENQLLEQLSEIIPKLMVWAGPEVLNAWKRLSTPSDTPLGPVAAAGNLITALRKELGHSDDSSLGQGCSMLALR